MSEDNRDPVRASERELFRSAIGPQWDFELAATWQGRHYRDLMTECAWKGWQARAAISTPNGWAAVSERLPPACHWLLVFAYRLGDESFRRRSRVVREYYVSTDPAQCVADDGITHWMPLPDPPKEPPPIKETR
jgi:hypothetical protein